MPRRNTNAVKDRMEEIRARKAEVRKELKPIAAIREIVELNIGHAIIARAVFDGLPKAVRDMKDLMRAAR